MPSRLLRIYYQPDTPLYLLAFIPLDIPPSEYCTAGVSARLISQLAYLINRKLFVRKLDPLVQSIVIESKIFIQSKLKICHEFGI